MTNNSFSIFFSKFSLTQNFVNPEFLGKNFLLILHLFLQILIFLFNFFRSKSFLPHFFGITTFCPKFIWIKNYIGFKSFLSCHYCGNNFKTRNDLMMHNKRNHTEKVQLRRNNVEYKCDFGDNMCWFIHDNVQSLYACSVCKKTSNPTWCIIRNKHIEKIYQNVKKIYIVALKINKNAKRPIEAHIVSTWEYLTIFREIEKT